MGSRCRRDRVSIPSSGNLPVGLKNPKSPAAIARKSQSPRRGTCLSDLALRVGPGGTRCASQSPRRGTCLSDRSLSLASVKPARRLSLNPLVGEPACRTGAAPDPQRRRYVSIPSSGNLPVGRRMARRASLVLPACLNPLVGEPACRTMTLHRDMGNTLIVSIPSSGNLPVGPKNPRQKLNGVGSLNPLVGEPACRTQVRSRERDRARQSQSPRRGTCLSDWGRTGHDFEHAGTVSIPSSGNLPVGPTRTS